MSLDKCITVPPITGPNCVTTTTTASCTGVGQMPINICPPGITPVPPAKCVNDNIRRPWPSPPPVEIGCNPVSIQVTNTVPTEEDQNQNIRLEGNVSYIAGDACLPQMNLNLVVPPDLGAGGGSPRISGFGYTNYAGCVRVGGLSTDTYKTPQDFYGNEPGAASFYPKSQGEMGNARCEPNCTARSRFGANVAKFNLIGPMLAEIQGHGVAMSRNVGGASIATGWRYAWNASVCVLASDMCLPTCGSTSWMTYNNSLLPDYAWNIKENVITGKLTPGTNLEDMVSKGYKPQPIMPGTQVLMYGWVPWGTQVSYNPTTQRWVAVADEGSCECEIVWFFSEQNSYDGECAEESSSTTSPSMLPTRKINSGGMFFGSPDNANRV